MTDPNASVWQSYQQSRQTGQAAIQEAVMLFKFVRSMVYMILWVSTIPVEVCMHTRFGVRYLNLLTIFAGMIAIQSWAVLAGPEAVAWGGWGSLLFLCLAVGHAAHARKLERDGVRVHSRSDGQPFAFWRKIPGEQTPFDIERYLEPMVVFAAGFALLQINRFGLVLMAMAVMLFAKKWIEYWKFRGAVLDQIDSQIEAENMAQWVDDSRSPWENDGFIVPKAAMKRAKTGSGPSVAEAMAATQGDNGEPAPWSPVEPKPALGVGHASAADPVRDLGPAAGPNPGSGSGSGSGPDSGPDSGPMIGGGWRGQLPPGD